jgi:hypothetical protein
MFKTEIRDYESSSDERGEGLTPRYKAQVEFRYTVKGKEYIQWSMSGSHSSGYKTIARRLGTTYAPGTHHMIRYNPADPAEIHFEFDFFDAFVVPVFLALLGLAFSAGGVKAFRVVVSGSADRTRGPSLWQRVKTSGPILRLRSLAATPRSRSGSTVRCPWCGKHVDGNQNVCPKCGRSLRAA